jgi:hypothetical protein
MSSSNKEVSGNATSEKTEAPPHAGGGGGGAGVPVSVLMNIFSAAAIRTPVSSLPPSPMPTPCIDEAPAGLLHGVGNNEVAVEMEPETSSSEESAQSSSSTPEVLEASAAALLSLTAATAEPAASIDSKIVVGLESDNRELRLGLMKVSVRAWRAITDADQSSTDLTSLVMALEEKQVMNRLITTVNLGQQTNVVYH